jgi:hypothetical protein
MENPEDISAWLWLVEVSETDAEKRRCLERILQIDPNHIPAQDALAAIKDRVQAPNLPHVSPFFQGEDVNAGSQPFSLPGENQTSSPFVVTPAEQNRPKLKSGPDPVAMRKPPLVAMILMGLVALSGLVYLGVRLLGG